MKAPGLGEGVEGDDQGDGGDDLNQQGAVDVEQATGQDQVEHPDEQHDVAVGPEPRRVAVVQIIEQVFQVPDNGVATGGDRQVAGVAVGVWCPINLVGLMGHAVLQRTAAVGFDVDHNRITRFLIRVQACAGSSTIASRPLPAALT